jgi:hypothetical protein
MFLVIDENSFLAEMPRTTPPAISSNPESDEGKRISDAVNWKERR